MNVPAAVIALLVTALLVAACAPAAPAAPRAVLDLPGVRDAEIIALTASPGRPAITASEKSRSASRASCALTSAPAAAPSSSCS